MDEVINYFQYFFQHFEKDINPIAGQIFGLLIQKLEAVSLTEIAEELELSKAAISIQIRVLNELGYCVKLPRKSDRKDYYKINEYFIEQTYQNKIRKKELFFEELTRILKQKANLSREITGRLITLQNFLKLQIDLQKRLLSEIKIMIKDHKENNLFNH